MMMDHRSRVEILTAILAGSSEDCGVPIAEVMYLSSLSYKHAKEYLTILTDHTRGISASVLISLLLFFPPRNFSIKRT